jgi:hypothetical protein
VVVLLSGASNLFMIAQIYHSVIYSSREEIIEYRLDLISTNVCQQRILINSQALRVQTFLAAFPVHRVPG